MTDLPFKYVAGDLSLDFVNTVDWTRHGLVDERLTSYERLTRWAEGAGVIPRQLASGLRARAEKHPQRAQSVLRDARKVRTLLQRVFFNLTTGRIDHRDLLALNRLLARATRERRVATTGRGRVRWQWSNLGRQLDSVLWPVVWAAANLISSEEAAEIRTCGGPTCGWMFVDRSRNRLRRWCEMETCGTREKSRRRAKTAAA